MSCRQWLPAEDRHCEQSSRPYIQGDRCTQHSPAVQAGRDVPPETPMERKP